MSTGPKQRRNHKVESMLLERGRDPRPDVQSRIRSAPSGNSRESEVDEGENCELDVQTEIEFVLLQIKVEALTAIVGGPPDR